MDCNSRMVLVTATYITKMVSHGNSVPLNNGFTITKSYFLISDMREKVEIKIISCAFKKWIHQNL